MKKILTVLALLGCGLAAAPAVRGQGYTDALLTSINFNTTFPCGNNGATDTLQIQAALQQAAKYGGGTVDLTCYQGAISLDLDIFTPISASILMYLPEHAVTVNANATIPSNFELCGGPGASIAAGGGFTLTNNATPCFNGFTSGGGGGSCPGVGANELQGNNGGVCGGVPGSTIDFTSGQIMLAALTADPVLLVSSQQGNDAIDAESLGNEDASTIFVYSNAVTNPGTSSRALNVASEAEDDTGAGAGSFAQVIVGDLFGANATGTLTVLDIAAGQNWTGGTPLSSIGINIAPSGSPGGFPAGTVSGISVGDQNVGDQAASTLNAAVSIQPQTAGPTVYGINDANGLFTFQGWNSPETDTLANLTTESASLPAEGFQKLCSDCDTPAYAGAACTTSGDMAGAVAVYIQNALYCYGKTATAPSGAPGGSPTQIQYNNAGAFGGIAGSAVDALGNVMLLSTGSSSWTDPSCADIGPNFCFEFPVSGNGAAFISSDESTTYHLGSEDFSISFQTGDIAFQSANTSGYFANFSGGGVASQSFQGGFNTGASGTDDLGIGDYILIGTQLSAQLNGATTGDILIGLDVGMIDTASSGNATQVSGIQIETPNNSAFALPVDTAGIYIKDQVSGGGPPTDASVGIEIDPQTQGAGSFTAYGIYDNEGLFTISGWNSPLTDPLSTLTAEVTNLPSEGFQKLCSDCDTPLTEGAVCTNVGDNAGALALYIRGALHCF